MLIQALILLFPTINILLNREGVLSPEIQEFVWTDFYCSIPLLLPDGI